MDLENIKQSKTSQSENKAKNHMIPSYVLYKTKTQRHRQTTVWWLPEEREWGD